MSSKSTDRYGCVVLEGIPPTSKRGEKKKRDCATPTLHSGALCSGSICFAVEDNKLLKKVYFLQMSVHNGVKYYFIRK